MARRWTVIESRTTFADRWLRVRTDRCTTGTGTIVDAYHVLEFPAWINAVALTETHDLVMAREYRHGAGTVLTGLPSGMLEPHESDAAAAMTRELREETGHAPREFHALGTFWSSPAGQSNELHCFLALGAHPVGPQRLDTTEDIEVILRPFGEVLSDLYTDPHAYYAGHAASLHLAVAWILRSPRADLAPLAAIVRDALMPTRS